jgi:hypothetical protein
MTRYRVENYADNATMFYVYEHHQDGHETIHAENLPSREDAEAEARRLEHQDNLIAAAPALLEAMDNLLFVINKDKDGSFFICEEAAPMLEAARDAIAKAKGGEA